MSPHFNQRRQTETHHEILEVHQRVLQQHAHLHEVQAKAREALKREFELQIGALRRPFLGRLRWLFTGK